MYGPAPAPQPQLAWAAGGDCGTTEVPRETLPSWGEAGCSSARGTQMLTVYSLFAMEKMTEKPSCGRDSLVAQ